MDTTGTFEIAEVLGTHGLVTALHKHYTVADYKKWIATPGGAAVLKYVAISAGSSEADMAKLSEVLALNSALQFICLDVANGYSEAFVECVRKVRAAHPNKTIFAGNVVTCEMTEALILAGADVVKVGIGPGSVCTTRVKTGVGYPQLSAVLECADAAHGLGGHVVSDGGCSVPGDVSKAFGAGADFAMLGGMLAGHDESGGQLVERPNGKKVKLFYGMSSATAMTKHSGGVAEYRASEGKTVEVPYRGPIAATVQDLLGGIRSTCTYVGAARLDELAPRVNFIRVTVQENKVFTGSESAQQVPAKKSESEANENGKRPREAGS
jgi:GMP reductase